MTITSDNNFRTHYFCSGITMMKLLLTLKYCLYTDESFFNCFASKMILLNILQKCHNLLCFANYINPLKLNISTPQHKSNFPQPWFQLWVILG